METNMAVAALATKTKKEPTPRMSSRRAKRNQFNLIPPVFFFQKHRRVNSLTPNNHEKLSTLSREWYHKWVSLCN